MSIAVQVCVDSQQVTPPAIDEQVPVDTVQVSVAPVQVVVQVPPVIHSGGAVTSPAGRAGNAWDDGDDGDAGVDTATTFGTDGNADAASRP